MSESDSNCGQSASDSEVAGDSSTAWKFIDEPSPQLQVEDVEAFLLSKTRTEANRVAKKLLVRIFGTEHRLPSDVTTQDIMKAWLDPSFFAVAQRHVNSSLAQSAFVSRSDLLKFLQVELWLAFYSVSPSNFYERSNKQYYPPVKSVMPSKRYFAILRAFGKPNAEDDVSSTNWRAPFQHDPNLSHAMDELRRLCSRFGFVSEVSIASLDDDLLRLRSSTVDDLGLTRTRNPKKGYGPVQHGIVSLATGIFLGGHIASKGETVVDVVKILQRGLCGATTDSQIRLPGIMFALDRGYQSKEVNKQILECGAAIIGTHKKNSSFPFTFGAAPKKHQKHVSEQGAKYAQWAVSKPVQRGAATPNQPSYALAYRSGLGNVVLCNTSVEAVGPGKWSYIVEQRQASTETTSDEITFKVFESSVHLLTKEIPQSQGNEQRDTAPQVTRSELERLTCADLRQKCKDQGVAGYGSKATLIDRILNQDDETTSPRTKSLEAVLIEAWFLKPKSSPEMKTGSKNEDSICSHLPPFFTANSSFTIQQMKSYGLLCRPEQRYLACSPDGIAYVTSPQSVTFFAVLEYKTRTTPTTIAKENAVATKRGKFVTVTLNSVNDSKTFKKLVPDQAHRSQLLHNLVCSSVKNGFLVYASTSTVIRVIHLVLSDDVVEAYLLAFERVNDSCLNWIYSSNEALPHLSTEELGHCGDIATLKQHLGLWRQLNDLVDKNDGPLPPAKHIIPTVIATWNRVKGGIDVYSRFLKNVHARHLHLPPLAAIWIRMLLSIVYNAYQSSQLLQSYSYLMFDTRCDSYSSFQQFKSENMSFNSFFSEAAQCIANLVAVENADLDFNNMTATGEDDDEGTASVAMSPKASTAYNKLNRFNEDPEIRQLRLSKRSTHHADLLSSNKQLTCIVCCQLNHDEENMPHSRKGFKTRYFCTICNVPLCKASRWKDGQSCFDRFHLLSNVPKPCQPSSSQRLKKIRPPPPSRKRSRDSIEPNERAITRLVPKKRRRSSRLMVRGA